MSLKVAGVDNLSLEKLFAIIYYVSSIKLSIFVWTVSMLHDPIMKVIQAFLYEYPSQK